MKKLFLLVLGVAFSGMWACSDGDVLCSDGSTNCDGPRDEKPVDGDKEPGTDEKEPGEQEPGGDKEPGTDEKEPGEQEPGGDETSWHKPNPGAKTECGDGVLEAGELCEVGQKQTLNDKPMTCIKNDAMRCVWKADDGSAVCGDGVVQDGEECDDGNSATADGCTSKCKKEAADVCQMRNGSTGKVVLVVDADTIKIDVVNDGKCMPKTVTVRMHGLDAPECLKTETKSPIREDYSAKACDPAQSENFEDRTKSEKGGLDGAEFVKSLVYSEENAGNVSIACETVSDKDSHCLLDNTLSRYLAYLGVQQGGQSVDLAEETVRAGYAMPFTMFTSQRIQAYCAAEKEAIANRAGVWSYGPSFEAVVRENFNEEKQSWLLDAKHCAE